MCLKTVPFSEPTSALFADIEASLNFLGQFLCVVVPVITKIPAYSAVFFSSIARFIIFLLILRSHSVVSDFVKTPIIWAENGPKSGAETSSEGKEPISPRLVASFLALLLAAQMSGRNAI